MDVFYTLLGQHFVWDSEKAATNIVKHGINFTTACQVFFDPQYKLEDGTEDDEERVIALGFSNGLRMLFVVHLQRSDGALRIISAREASKQERRRYEVNKRTL